MSQLVSTGPGWTLAEEWRSVPGFDLYEASTRGRIRSWAVRGYLGMRARKPTILRQEIGADGHRRVCLGRHARIGVHVLVAMTFIGPRGDAEVCRHIDGDPANNAPTNLAWGSSQENSLDKHAHGTMLVGETHPAAKLTDDHVRAIRASIESVSALSRRFGVSRTSIRRARDGRNWIHVV